MPPRSLPAGRPPRDLLPSLRHSRRHLPSPSQAMRLTIVGARYACTSPAFGVVPAVGKGGGRTFCVGVLSGWDCGRRGWNGLTRGFHAPPPLPPSSSGLPPPSWVTKLESRALLHVHGKDAADLLQRLSTNDLSNIVPGPQESGVQLKTQTRSEDGDMRAAYTTFLTREGRLLYDAIVVPTVTVESSPDSGVLFVPSFLLDVDVAAGAALRKHLLKYKLRSKVKVDDVTDDNDVYVASGPAATELLGSTKLKSFGVDGMKMLADPRGLPELGVRIITPKDMPRPSFDAMLEPVAPATYNRVRMSVGVAEGPSELEPGKMVPLECNVVALQGISFDKGCYLGQELQARTYHTGVIRKRLLPMRFGESFGTQDVKVGSEIRTEAGKKVGTVVAVEGDVGVGMVRLKEAFVDRAKLFVVGVGGEDSATGPVDLASASACQVPITVALPDHIKAEVEASLEPAAQ